MTKSHNRLYIADTAPRTVWRWEHTDFVQTHGLRRIPYSSGALRRVVILLQRLAYLSDTYSVYAHDEDVFVRGIQMSQIRSDQSIWSRCRSPKARRFGEAARPYATLASLGLFPLSHRPSCG